MRSLGAGMPTTNNNGHQNVSRRNFSNLFYQGKKSSKKHYI